MNRNVIIVLVGGALVAILVAVLVQASLSGGKKNAPVAVASVPKVEILVAAKDLSVGTELSESGMRWQEWPKDAVFPGAVVREDKKGTIESLEGRLRRAVVEGEPLTKAVLVSETAGNFLAATLKDGMRAVAIDVKAASAVAGFVGPGDYVDVMLTYKASVDVDRDDKDMERVVQRNLDRWATETVLENVRVVAIDQKYDREGDDVKVGKTVTLEVDRRGAEILALAGEMGTLSLSLRKLGDESITTERVPVTTDARVTNILDEVYEEMEEVKKHTGKSRGSITVYEGSSMSKQSTGR